MAGQPISVSTANAMISQYVTYMKSLGVDMRYQTESVSFSGPELMHWLAEVMPYADELRIFMGDYPTGHSQAGRTSVILWPYKNGLPATMPVIEGKDGGGTGDEPVDPYNEGQGHP